MLPGAPQTGQYALEQVAGFEVEDRPEGEVGDRPRQRGEPLRLGASAAGSGSTDRKACVFGAAAAAGSRKLGGNGDSTRFR